MRLKFLLSLIAFSAGMFFLQAQPVITLPPTNQVLAVGATLTLNTTASGTAPLSYQWFKDSRFLLGATNSTLTVTNAGLTNSGTYYVLVTNTSGMAISYPALVKVGHVFLLAWGDNNFAELGIGNGWIDRTNRPIIVGSGPMAGAAGARHSLFIKSDGTLWAMGENTYGQLGDFTNDDLNIFPLPINIASNVVAVATGIYYSLFVKADGTLWAMGRNTFGQLGDGTTNDTFTPVNVASNVVAVAAGYGHSLFIKTNGTLWAMGYNNYGQLGNNTTNDAHKPICVASNVVAVAAGYEHSLFLKRDRKLWTMGFNYSGQLGNGTTNDRHTPISMASNVVAVAAGAGHSLFIKTNGILWAVGYNYFGQLGNGTTDDALKPISVASNVVAVAAGATHSLFVKTNGALWAMGSNFYGELGNGSNSDSSLPVNVTNLLVANVFPGEQAAHSLAMGTIMGFIQQPTIMNFAATIAQGQHVALQLSGTPDYPFILQAATNLTPPVNWQPVLTNLADVNGNWSITVSNITAPSIFFRATAQ